MRAALRRHQVLIRWVVTLAAIAYTVTVSLSVQAAREYSIRLSCQEQNERHDNVIRQLDSIYADALKKATPKERAQINEGRAPTLLLIDALAPKRDCEKRVQQLSHP